MTPARFDLLFALFDNAKMRDPPLRGRPRRIFGPGDYWTSQVSIRERLGLHLSTVSKMITRLVELGLLATREDGRVRIVFFTDRGLRLFREALKYVFGERYLVTLFRRHVWPKRTMRSRSRWRMHEAVWLLFQKVKRIAYCLGDNTGALYWFRHTGLGHRQTSDQADTRRWRKELLAGRFVCSASNRQ